MPRVKKSAIKTNLAEENEKLSCEIAKAEAKIADAKAKIKANTEKIFRDKIDRIVNSGFTIDEVINLIEEMSKKNITVQDIISLIDDSSAAEIHETDDTGQGEQETVKAGHFSTAMPQRIKNMLEEKNKPVEPEAVEKDAEELDKMLASLPSYD